MVDSGVGVADDKDIADRAVLAVAVAVACGNIGNAILNSRAVGTESEEAREARCGRSAGCAWARARLSALEITAEDVAVLTSRAAK